MSKCCDIIFAILIVLIIIFFFKDSGFDEEYFALEVGTTTNKSDLDLSKYYKVGKRNTSKTEIEAINGGTPCIEYPDVAYQLAPAEPAKCRGDIMNTYYDFEPVGKQGYNFIPFYFRNTSGLAIHPEGGSETPAEGTYAVIHYAEPAAKKTHFTMDKNGIIRHSGGLCLAAYSNGTTNGDRLVLNSACNQPFIITADNKLVHKNSGRWIHPEGGNPGRVAARLVTWNDPNPTVTTYTPTLGQ
jgi:hypothetical protein